MPPIDKIEFDIVAEMAGFRRALDRVEADCKATADKLEQAFSDAGEKAGKEMADNIKSELDDIEPEAKEKGGDAGSAFGESFGKNLAAKLASGVVLAAVAYAAKKVVDTYNDAIETAKLSKLTGATPETVQGIASFGRSSGVSDPAKGMEDLVVKLNEARREENEISKLLDANNIKWKLNKDEVIGLQQAMEAAAKLISNAATEADKIKIAEILGLSKEWIEALEKGPEALREYQRKLGESGRLIDSEMIAKAKQFDEAWRQSSEQSSQYVKAFIVRAGEMVIGLGELAAKVWADAFKNPLAKRIDDASQPDQPMTSEVAPGLYVDLGAQLRKTLEANAYKFLRPGRAPLPGNATLPPTAPIPNDRPATAKTVIPGKDKPSGGGSSSTDSNDDETKVKRVNDLLDARLKKLTLNNEELAKAEIAEQTILYLRQADAVTDSFKQIGSTLVDALADFAIKGEKGIDIAKRLGEQLARAALQSALLGQGPLAGLMGTTAKDGAGGLLGLIVGAFKGTGSSIGALGTPAGSGFAPWLTRAGGGPASGWTQVGEHGPEIVRLPRGSHVYDNAASRQMMSGGGGGNRYTINQTIVGNGDATIAAIARQAVVEGITANNRNFLQNEAAARMRGA